MKATEEIVKERSGTDVVFRCLFSTSEALVRSRVTTDLPYVTSNIPLHWVACPLASLFSRPLIIVYIFLQHSHRQYHLLRSVLHLFLTLTPDTVAL